LEGSALLTALVGRTGVSCGRVSRFRVRVHSGGHLDERRASPEVRISGQSRAVGGGATGFAPGLNRQLEYRLL